MSRPGWLVAAELEARDEAERKGWDLDYLPDPSDCGPPVPVHVTERVPEVDAAYERHYRSERERLERERRAKCEGREWWEGP